MGIYVDKIADPPFEWGDEVIPSTGSEQTRDLVEQKFEATMATAEEMLERMVGVDGNSGFLGQLNSMIAEFPAVPIDDFTVTIPTISITPDSRPAPDLSGIDTDFPLFTTSAPSLPALPTIDLTSLNPADLPEAISGAISWLETAHDTTLFDELMTRLIADLQTGATGLSAAVEQGIFDRELARQNIEEDKIQTEIEEYFSSTGFDLPTGALASRLAEHANGRAMRVLDLNQKIAHEQAELAQKNSQFCLQAAKDLEAVLRDFTSKKNDRSLDYAKAVAVNAIAIYAEGIKAYMAAAEANKIYVEVQVENLKAVVEYAKGLVSLYSAEAEAFGTVIEAKAKKNEAITSVFASEIAGYDAETRAVSASQATTIEEYRLKIQNADLQLRTAIAEVDAALRAYESESNLKAGVSKDMANLAMQAYASSVGAVNASAGVSHQTGISKSEGFTHTETRSDDHNRSNTLGESHTYEEDPA